jgi:hypothetical protein
MAVAAGSSTGGKRVLRHSRVIISVAAVVLVLGLGLIVINLHRSGGPGKLSAAAGPSTNGTLSSGVAAPTSISPGPSLSGSASRSPGAPPGSGNNQGPALAPPPAPLSGNGCAPFPAFPDQSCTGWQHTGVKLHTCSGDLKTPNVTLDSCDFPDGVEVKAANIKITRSHIKGIVSPNYLMDFDFRNLTLIDVEIENKGFVDPNGQAAIGSNDYTCIRCNIHDTGRGFNMGENVVIRDSFAHDFTYTNGAHQTAAGANGGSNFTLIHNNFQCNSNNEGCSSAVSLYDQPTIDNVLLQQNLFNTDGGYETYAGGHGGTNIRYIDNRFGKLFHSQGGQFGPVAIWYPNAGNVWTGNAWQDGSGEVSPSS